MYISRLCYDVSVHLSVRLSVTEVQWRIIANLRFKFRSKFRAHCRRGEGSTTTSHAMLATARPSCFDSSRYVAMQPVKDESQHFCGPIYLVALPF